MEGKATALFPLSGDEGASGRWTELNSFDTVDAYDLFYGPDMFSHITVGTNDLARAMQFYGQVLQTIGIGVAAVKSSPARAIYRGSDPGSDAAFCVYAPINGVAASVGNGSMVAFEANSPAAVDMFYQAAIACGGVDEGKPGLRPRYSPTFYAAYVRDLDGNKLCCVSTRDA